VLTNLGIFRAYVNAYLEENKKVHDDMTFVVRQLPPSPEGLPLEVYVFSTDTDLVDYEKVQADIFDHLLAAVPFFDLRVFQHPTGHDLRMLRERVSDEPVAE
jgi:miniconductance mechanosensitive channel